MVDAAGIVPIILLNQANKTVRIKEAKEVGRALILRNIQRVKIEKRRKVFRAGRRARKRRNRGPL